MGKVIITIDKKGIKKELHLNNKIYTEVWIKTEMGLESHSVLHTIEGLDENLIEAIDDMNDYEILQGLNSLDKQN